MNAVMLSNIQLKNLIFKTHFLKILDSRRTLKRFIRWSSFVIDTGVDELGQAFTKEEEATSPTESLAQGLIFLCHTKSSWRDRSLWGLGFDFFFFLI